MTMPIKAFRAEHGLSDTFGVRLFEPKDFDGLARIDQVGASLNDLRTAILGTLPEKLAYSDLIPFLDTLQQIFRSGLIGINASVGLTIDQLEFAVAGFGDVCRAWGYALVRARATRTTPVFREVYHQWVSDSERISMETHDYDHHGQPWTIQIVNNVYGRTGLLVITPESEYHVIDSLYACPAEGFMASLLTDVADKLAVAVTA